MLIDMANEESDSQTGSERSDDSLERDHGRNVNGVQVRDIKLDSDGDIDEGDEDYDSPLMVDNSNKISGASSTMQSGGGPKPQRVMGFKTKYGMKGPGMLQTIQEVKDEKGSTGTTAFPGKQTIGGKSSVQSQSSGPFK